MLLLRTRGVASNKVASLTDRQQLLLTAAANIHMPFCKIVKGAQGVELQHFIALPAPGCPMNGDSIKALLERGILALLRRVRNVCRSRCEHCSKTSARRVIQRSPGAQQFFRVA